MPSPAVYPALATIGGIATGVCLPGLASMALLVMVAALVLTAAAWRLGRAGAFTGCLLIGFAAAGALMGASRMTAAARPPLREFFHDARARSADGLSPVVLEGRLRADSAPTEYGASLLLDVARIQTACGWLPAKGGLRLAVNGDLASRMADDWRAGRRVRATALLRLPATFRNSGATDEAFGMARRGIALVGSAKSAALIEVIGRGHAFAESAGALRGYTRRTVAAAIPGRPVAAAIVTAILIGDRGGMDAELQRRLQEAGTYHVIAISGGNVAILAGLAFLALRALGVPSRPGSLALAAGLCAYGYLSGGAPSVARATIAAAVYLVATAADHRSPAVNVLASVALAAVMYEPLGVFDPGLLLSYGATLALLIGGGRILRRRGSGGAETRKDAEAQRHRRLPPGVKQPPSQRESDRRAGPGERDPGLAPTLRIAATSTHSASLRRLCASATSASRFVLTGTVCAELALFPIGAMMFNRITLAGLALNFAAIPLMTVAQVCGIVILILSPISPALARAVGLVGGYAAEGLTRSTWLVDVAPWLTWRVAAPPAALVATYFVGWVLVLLATRSRLVRVVGAAGTAFAAILIAVPGLADGTIVARSPARGHLRLTVLDVGQGDAILVQFPGSHSMLVDAAGLAGASFDLGDRVITPAMLSLGVRRLDYLAVTHGDPDHVLGAPSIARDFRPRELWEGVPVPPHEALRGLRSVVTRRGGAIRLVRPGDRLTIGGVDVYVLHPPEPDWERQRVRNDDSIVLELRYGDVSIVLPGDIGAAVEESIVGRLSDAPIRILKAAHHGSATSSGDAWLAGARPAAVIFSCGRDNRYGHPAASVLQRMAARRIPVFRTDHDGAVTVTTDGTAAVVSTFTGRLSRVVKFQSNRNTDGTGPPV